MSNLIQRTLRGAMIALALGAVAACTTQETPAPAAPAKPAAPAAPTAAPAAPATGYTEAAVTNGGTISGKVTLMGAKPKLEPEKRNKDPKVCGTSGPNESLIVGPGEGVKNAIVAITDIHSGKKLAPMDATLDQTKCSYVPHVQAVPMGSNLVVINSDGVLHNVHASQGAATVFNYAMPIKGQKTPPKKLDKAGLIHLKCDVHGWMNGAIAVEDNPYFAVTGDDGSFTLADVPAGSYTLHVWHERLGEQDQKVTVAAGGKATVDFKLAAK
ncbi:MAG TPA: carboxypeptidase regulatory-like domain-containing protein [Myxococcales bacterium]|nr:carboxypeptidase regulatory-like domain-containing protein [Myxococcales bacterium]